ncbi:MAG: tetratricopeptide repeat protein [Acidobacteriota bacterium]
MFSGPALFLLLFSLLPVQTSRDSIQLHYEKAEALRRSGNLSGAEFEFTAMLGEAYHRLGRVRLAQANYAAAVNALETAAAYRPDSDAVLIDLGVAYFHAAQYDKALNPLSKAASRSPNNPGAYHMLGKSHFMLGNFEKATAELEHALKLSPNDYDVAYTLGLAHLKQQKIQLAKDIYDRMIQRLGNRAQLRVLIGRAYRETGFLSEAIDEFQKALALDSHFPRVHYYLGLTYLLKGGVDKLGQAQEHFRIELANHPDEFFAHYYLGIAATVERNWTGALGYLQKASQLQSNNPDPYFFMGQAFQGLNRNAEAVEAFKKTIALDPGVKHNDYQVTNAHYRLGQVLMKMGFTAEGEQELKIAADLKTAAFKRDEVRVEAFTATEENKLSELVEGMKADAPAQDAATRAMLQNDGNFYAKVVAAAHNNVGLLRAERQDFRAAAEQFRLAGKWDPQLEGLNFNLGLASYKAEQYADALSPLANELKAHPGNIAAKQLLGLSYFMTDNYPQASALLTEVVALKPNEAALYYPLALSLINQNKKEEANHFIQQMVALGSNSPQLHILLGRAAYDQGDSAKALEELQLAVSLDNKVLLAHLYSGVVYLKLGKFEEAGKEFAAELALNPNDLQAKYNLAYVLLAGQETERGIKLMREVILQKPQLADARYELGKALLKRGDQKEAIETLEVASKLAPGKAHIHYQLGRAYLAAGRKSEGDGHIEISKQLKEKERTQTDP